MLLRSQLSEETHFPMMVQRPMHKKKKRIVRTGTRADVNMLWIVVSRFNTLQFARSIPCVKDCRHLGGVVPGCLHCTESWRLSQWTPCSLASHDQVDDDDASGGGGCLIMLEHTVSLNVSIAALRNIARELPRREAIPRCCIQKYERSFFCGRGQRKR